MNYLPPPVLPPFSETPAVVGQQFVATLAAPPAGLTAQLGARVELPVSRAIVSAWQPAAVTSSQASVVLDSPVTAGFYNLVWRTNDAEPPQFEAFVPLSVINASDVQLGVDWPPIDPDAIRPTTAEVALLERTRTVDQTTGEELGIFAANTRPTDEQVDQLIDQAIDDVLSELRPWVDPARYSQIKRTVTFYTAMMIEGSYYREQVNERGGPLWQDDYREALKNLQARIEQDWAENNLVGTMEPGPRPLRGDGSTTGILA